MPSISELTSNEKLASSLAFGQEVAKKHLSEGRVGRVLNGFPPLLDSAAYSALKAKYIKLANQFLDKRSQLKNLNELSHAEITAQCESEIKQVKELIEKDVIELSINELIDPLTETVKQEIINSLFKDFTEQDKELILKNPVAVVSSLVENIVNQLIPDFKDYKLEAKYSSTFCEGIKSAEEKGKNQHLQGRQLENAIKKEFGEDYTNYVDYKDAVTQAIEPLMMLNSAHEKKSIEIKLQSKCQAKREEIASELFGILKPKAIELKNTVSQGNIEDKNQDLLALDRLDKKELKSKYIDIAMAFIEQFKASKISINDLHLALNVNYEQVKKIGHLDMMGKAASKMFNFFGYELGSTTERRLYQAMEVLEKHQPELKSLSPIINQNDSQKNNISPPKQ